MRLSTIKLSGAEVVSVVTAAGLVPVTVVNEKCGKK